MPNVMNHINENMLLNTNNKPQKREHNPNASSYIHQKQKRRYFITKFWTLRKTSFRRIPFTMFPAPGLRANLANLTFCNIFQE